MVAICFTSHRSRPHEIPHADHRMACYAIFQWKSIPPTPISISVRFSTHKLHQIRFRTQLIQTKPRRTETELRDEAEISWGAWDSRTSCAHSHPVRYANSEPIFTQTDEHNPAAGGGWTMTASSQPVLRQSLTLCSLRVRNRRRLVIIIIIIVKAHFPNKWTICFFLRGRAPFCMACCCAACWCS